MKVLSIGNIADAFRFDDLPATGIVIEATPDELERLPNLAYKDVTISAMPRRNCDVLKLREGRPCDMADQVWRAYKQSHMGSYLDVCDLLRCIGWLLSPATEQEGGNDGNE